MTSLTPSRLPHPGQVSSAAIASSCPTPVGEEFALAPEDVRLHAAARALGARTAPARLT